MGPSPVWVGNDDIGEAPREAETDWRFDPSLSNRKALQNSNGSATLGFGANQVGDVPVSLIKLILMVPDGLGPIALARGTGCTV